MSQLCTYCAELSIAHLVQLTKTEFIAHDFPRRAFYPHHRSFHDLEDSALQGCAFCLLVLQRFKGTRYNTADWPKEWTGPECDVDNSDSMYAEALRLEESDVKIAINSSHVYMTDIIIDVKVFDQIMVQVGPQAELAPSEGDAGIDWEPDYGEYFPPLPLTITAPQGRAVAIDGYRIGRVPVDENLGSPTNCELARDWLRDCQTNHPTCLSGKASKLPTRVVDVGLKCDEQPRLVHSGDREAHYVALSHCWGGPIPTVLTRNSLKAFETALPYDPLPANFQDAITITRELGVQYLWIDSLCIVQDSKEDWEKESKTMCDVYRNSVVTISAMASGKSTDGILGCKSKPSGNLKPALLKVSANDSASKEEVVVEPYSYDEDLKLLDQRGQLSQRGWVMQESLLSPRQLCYGVRQLYFKCPLGFNSADGVAYRNRNPEVTWKRILQILHSDILRQQPGLTPAVDSILILEEYYTIVREYLQRKLTFDSDKLPAFSGISQLLHRAIGGQYMAGLWSSDFNRGLLWHAEMRECKHVKEYRAPSWSWAVTNDQVMWRLREPDEYSADSAGLNLRLVQAMITPRDANNPFGELRSGSVRVDAVTIPFVRSKQLVPNIPRNNIGDCSLDGIPDDCHDYTSAPRVLLLANDDSGEYMIGISSSYPVGEPIYELDTECFCSPESCIAVIVNVYMGTPHYGPSAEGLLLRQLEGHLEQMYDEEVYERIGYFRLDNLDTKRIQRWARRSLTIV